MSYTRRKDEKLRSNPEDNNHHYLGERLKLGLTWYLWFSFPPYSRREGQTPVAADMEPCTPPPILHEACPSPHHNTSRLPTNFKSFHHTNSPYGLPWCKSFAAETVAEIMNSYYTGASVTTLAHRFDSEPSPTASSLELGLETMNSRMSSYIFLIVSRQNHSGSA